MAILAAITAAAAVAGAATSVFGTIKQAEAQKTASRASQQAEALRKQQMELDSRRRMNQLMRASATARARSIAAASARGATFSSAAEGGLGSIQSQTGFNVLSEAENLDIGRDIFDANATFSQAKASAANYDAIGDFGKTLFQNSQTIGQIGTTLFTGSRGPIGSWETTVSR